MSSDFFLAGSFKKGEGGLYFGVVVKQQGKAIEVLTVGIESTEMLILEWIKDTIKLMRESGQFDVQASDMVDRVAQTPGWFNR